MLNVYCLNCNLRFAISDFASRIFQSLMFNLSCLILIKTDFVCKIRKKIVTLHPKREKSVEKAQKIDIFRYKPINKQK